ncbi:MAG: TlpA family protein disulfide reductase [candidate division KSB1 bacterium]|nr:TlpA family protein disulfide reductase [candidate division KSB1 bacterium]MDZ7369028.1 TlpA family protein disulfide reductase [candidate division KSB1 bacterium]MDZ7407048.1 TlpA family protein disulfide reductase [candidate division KSB1 bacterium]
MAFLFLLALAPALAQNNAETPAAVDFTARDLDGKKIQLKNILAKGPVLLDFWALWCVPCLKEMPQLQKLAAQYQKQGLTIIAVNQDSPSDQSKVKPFIKQKRYDFVTVFDEDKDLAKQFNVSILPTTLLLDQNGKVVYAHTGYKPGDEAKLAEQISKLIAAGGRKQ